MKADVTVGAVCRSSGAVGLSGGGAPAGGYTVSLTSSDPSIAAVPATVTIPEGFKATSFAIVGKTVGTANITASVSGSTATKAVTVVKPTFEWFDVSTQITLGATRGIQVWTYVPNGSYYEYYSYSDTAYKYSGSAQYVDEDLTVSLSSENPTVIQAPATAKIPAGGYYSSVNIQTVAIGTSTLTASASGWDSKTSETITVVPPDLWIKADVTVGAGTQTTGMVGFAGGSPPVQGYMINSTNSDRSAVGIAPAGYTINLTSSDPSVATVPETVTTYGSVGTFTIVGKSEGTAEITASMPGYTATSTVTVVKPAFTWSDMWIGFPVTL